MQNYNGLKVGDKVVITRASTKEDRDAELWYNSWVDDMNAWVGKTVTIVELYGKNEARIKEYGWGWPTFVMKKVNVQLLFDFMEEDSYVRQD